MSKQMEGDNVERRKRAREAREQGSTPSEEKVTKGASKQRHHLPRSEETETKLMTKDQGKRT
jgi:hypothetical protein